MTTHQKSTELSPTSAPGVSSASQWAAWWIALSAGVRPRGSPAARDDGGRQSAIALTSNRQVGSRVLRSRWRKNIRLE